MRWLRLYLRSRRVPVAVTIVASAVGMVWWMWLAFGDSHLVDPRGVSLTVMLAVAALAPTLGGPDDALERTAAISWPVRRAVHVLAAGAGIVGLLALTRLTDARFEPVPVVLRDTAGLLGLAALGAALFGAGRAWVAPLTWTLVAVSPWLGPSSRTSIQVVAWQVQPAGTAAATGCAVVLAVGGLLGYAIAGCPRRPATETGPEH